VLYAFRTCILLDAFMVSFVPVFEDSFITLSVRSSLPYSTSLSEVVPVLNQVPLLEDASFP
jgi:hypothetical protein